MAAEIHEPTGTTAGRVTIVTTLASLLPTIVVCAIIVIAFLVQMISAEIAAAMLLTALGLGPSISSTVFATAKKTPTDQARLIWGSQPVSDAVTAPPGTAALPGDPRAYRTAGGRTGPRSRPGA